MNFDVVGEGRTATVVLVDERTVAKVDKPGWEGLAAHEFGLLQRLASAGLPVPEPFDLTAIDGRPALAMERLTGPTLAEQLEGADDARFDVVAEELVALQELVHRCRLPDLPDFVERLSREAAAAGFGALPIPPVGARGVCHADLNPKNLIVTDRGLRIVDWLTVADGPLSAEFARTWILLSEPVRSVDPSRRRLADYYRRCAERHRSVGDDLQRWVRVAAAARLAEGFDDERVGWLRAVARESRR